MKTAVSVPDNVFESAESLANRLGQSRSQLYTRALRSYLKRHAGDDVTKKLNELYEVTDSKVEPVLAKLQSQSLFKDKW